MTNSVDPDQTAPSGAVWSGSALFASIIFSEILLHEILGHVEISTVLDKEYPNTVDSRYLDPSLSRSYHLCRTDF